MATASLHLDDDRDSPDPELESPTAIEGSGSAPSPAKEQAQWLREFARIESAQWQPAARRGRSQSIEYTRGVIAALEKHVAAGEEALVFLARQDREWILDNVRLIRTASREVFEGRKALPRQPHLVGRGGRVEARPQVIAAAFLRAVKFRFDEEALSAFVNGWQENQTLETGELWVLKSALQLSALEELTHALAPLLEQDNPGFLSVRTPGRFPIPRLITTLRDIGAADWEDLVERASVADGILRRDPAAAYPRMDSESRRLYREAIVDLARQSGRSESQIAEAAISLAQAPPDRKAGHAGLLERESHVGHYLVDAGLTHLRRRIGLPARGRRLPDLLVRFPNTFYLVGFEILTFLIVIVVLGGLPRLAPIVGSFFFLLIPATQAALELMNAIATSVLPPRRLPKLDFSEGIPDAYTSMVVVTALLLSKEHVKELVDGLEVRYLANRDRNLYFALVTDAPDSRERFDAKEALAADCSRRIDELNRQYGTFGTGPFLLFHRHRIFNSCENTWMGWERKRGKLLDLIQLLRGGGDKFPVKVGDLSVLPHIRFVITLDTDTQLPRDAAHRLVGTLAHPLNRAVIDPATNTVVAGYGILQPRVGISVQSASRSRLASIYSGQTGFDIYSRAVSDVYQDLYGEAIFTGKGIFDVDVFQQVLNERFPCNTLLSHDLIEGAYAGVALVSDVEVIDDYPSHFSAYSRRRHRWVRGDWQTVPWLLPRVRDYHGRLVPNPTSVISRWKIFDNLRRSLIDPFLFGLLLAGWFILPGPAWYWTVATVALLLLPVYARALLSLLRALHGRCFAGTLRSTSVEFAKGHLSVLLALTFLAHQALVMMDAIVRTLVRYRITRRRLLEWETAAEAESGSAGRRPADTCLAWTPRLALGLTLALAFIRPEACPYAFPFLLLWAGAGSVARWLSRRRADAGIGVSASQQKFLRHSALHIWRYFQENSGPQDNWLIPDNIQESPWVAAHRASPTNLGLLLNARQAACYLGYLTPLEFVALTKRTLSVMGLMQRHNGHFFNWYDTRTLEPLEPLVISTVDSGNLAASLWTLKQGCLSVAEEPVFPRSMWQGLLDHVCILHELDPGGTRRLDTLAKELDANGARWMAELDAVEREAQALLSSPKESARWWAEALVERISAVRALAGALTPWLLVRCPGMLRDLTGDPAELTLEGIAAVATRVRGRRSSRPFDKELEAAARAADTAKMLRADLRCLAAEAGRIAGEMDFRFLYDRRKRLLSVGYDVPARRLQAAAYDLLASEARMAAFVAVAKGDIPQESWFRLGRGLTSCRGHRILLSWTGTMFEYLMPTLWMKVFPNTIMEQSTRAVSAIQQAYCRNLRTPWGVSESAYAATDGNGCYQYRAFGLPMLALKRASTGRHVVAPYAGFLALAMDPTAAIRNLRAMWKRRWAGKYGLYEAVDFAEGASNRRKPTVVRCWMAHHQAMGLMAIVNRLRGSPFQRWFHSEPQVMATELLLHEKIPAGVRVSSHPYFKPPVSEGSAAYVPDCAPAPGIPN